MRGQRAGGAKHFRIPKEFLAIGVEIPKWVERTEVSFPCRKNGQKDFIYKAITKDDANFIKSILGRFYARSLREVMYLDSLARN